MDRCDTIDMTDINAIIYYSGSNIGESLDVAYYKHGRKVGFATR